jgi:predicted ribosomally synthesized peptide with nif11-like leader
MSKENLEQFMSKVADSEELQAKIGEQIDAEALIALGAECGCEFTAEELQEAAELSDDELDEVAGGKVAPRGFSAARPKEHLWAALTWKYSQRGARY